MSFGCRPNAIDVGRADSWPSQRYDGVFSANTLHIVNMVDRLVVATPLSSLAMRRISRLFAAFIAVNN